MKLQTLFEHLPATQGSVIAHIPSNQFPHSSELSLDGNAPLLCYRCDTPVVLEYAGGMPLLLLSYKDAPLFFYLDRLVQLNPGTVFSFAPLINTCCVRVYLPHGAHLEVVGQHPASVLQQAPSSLLFHRVCTAFYQISDSSFYFGGEQHEPYELVFMDNGTLHNVVNGQDIILQSQELLLFDRNTWHMQYSDAPVRFLTVTFLCDNSFLHTICEKKLFPSLYAKTLLQQIVQEQQKTDVFTEERIAILVQLLLIELIRYNEKPIATSRSLPKTIQAENDMIDKSVRYIADHIYGTITLEQLSSAVHASVPYLCRVFPSHLGMPPGQYINRIRLEACKAELRKQTKSIGEIASMFGFSSTQHFSRQFHRVLGITPTDYLRSLL